MFPISALEDSFWTKLYLIPTLLGLWFTRLLSMVRFIYTKIFYKACTFYLLKITDALISDFIVLSLTCRYRFLLIAIFFQETIIDIQKKIYIYFH